MLEAVGAVLGILAAVFALVKWLLLPRFEAALRSALAPELQQLTTLSEESTASAEWRSNVDRRLEAMESAVEEAQGLRKTVENLVKGVDKLEGIMLQSVQQIGELTGEIRAQRKERGA